MSEDESFLYILHTFLYFNKINVVHKSFLFFYIEFDNLIGFYKYHNLGHRESNNRWLIIKVIVSLL